MSATRWGEAIQRLQAERKWTKQKLAELAGVRPNTLTNIIKHGRPTDPTTLDRIADAFGVDLAEMFLTAEAAALVNELLEARDEKHLLRVQKQLAKQDLLIVDELGYVPLSKTGAELLFEVFSQRYEQASTLVTSNLPFNEWTETFGSERLTGAPPTPPRPETFPPATPPAVRTGFHFV